MNWLEVSLTVDGEAAEAVADVLTRFAPEGVAIEASQVRQAPHSEQGLAAGPVIVRAYLPADADLETRRRQLEEALWHLGQILPLPAPAYTPVAAADWSESWKANFKPVRVGRRLLIVPAWLYESIQRDASTRPEDIAIRLDPGMAFGTGTHPTTQLCLAALERHLVPGSRMLDLGTGSGILAVAAARLGASAVLGVDIDAEAVRVARENIALNEVAGQVRIEAGSLREVRDGIFGAEWAQSGLVVANILAKIILDLLDAGLAQTALPGGWLVLSGILDTQALEVRAALTRHGLQLLAQEHHEDWVALIARRPA